MLFRQSFTHRQWSNAAIRLGLIITMLFASVLLHARGVSAADDVWEWRNPLPQGNSLSGVWTGSNSDVFAVGQGGTILHHDGSGWSEQESGTTEWLQAVWGSSGSDVFAVGEGGSILHYSTDTLKEIFLPYVEAGE